jgi:hypothetical protein
VETTASNSASTKCITEIELISASLGSSHLLTASLIIVILQLAAKTTTLLSCLAGGFKLACNAQATNRESR